MNRYLRCILPVLLVLTATGCKSTATSTERSLFVSAAEADANNQRALQALSDEPDVAGGLVVYFDTDSSAIEPAYQARLAYVANYLVTNPEAEVFVEGHTDDVGSPEQNIVLAQARAAMIAYYLVKYGALYEQVNVHAYGEHSPVCEGSGKDDLKYNRRGVVEWVSHGQTLGYEFERR
ncbi:MULTISPECIES: OmpA family protein [Pseudomonas]|uniref:Peptidoglycan-associated lipoprotein n=1 Tax=Pseudomonas fluorescens TaxID=294 RepID=A0A5E6VPQ8_PSEFL|nr:MULTISPECIES: OmpA family protein [Pseudomonas]VVN19603.1 Peptidoglycan-associated lipoprotein [Pseudomonas fluorescens]